MTLATFFESTNTVPQTTTFEPPFQFFDRGGGWNGGGKGKGKGIQSALSALTLLSFLFFLNLLQSCLRENLQSDSPLIIMMTTTTTTGRLRRSTLKGDSADMPIKNYPLQIYRSQIKSINKNYLNNNEVDTNVLKSIKNYKTTEQNITENKDHNKITVERNGLNSTFCCEYLYCKIRTTFSHFFGPYLKSGWKSICVDFNVNISLTTCKEFILKCYAHKGESKK